MLVIRLAPVSETRQLSSDNSAQSVGLMRATSYGALG